MYQDYSTFQNTSQIIIHCWYESTKVWYESLLSSNYLRSLFLGTPLLSGTRNRRGVLLQQDISLPETRALYLCLEV